MDYHPSMTEAPTRNMALSAIGDLFTYLLKYKQDPEDDDTITRLLLAAFVSLGTAGYDMTAGLGRSNAVRYALGSPYGIPHGIMACLPLPSVATMKAQHPKSAPELARILPYIGQTRCGNDKQDALKVPQAITDLVKQLSLKE